MKIKSATKKHKFIYIDLLKNKKSKTLIVFLSGLSGSKELPLFKYVDKQFFKKGFDTVRINFATDSDDKYKKNDALKESDLSFSVYNSELKNILDSFEYKKIILIGHSFGAIIFMQFLKKYNAYKNKVRLVLWDPSVLPWEKKYLDSNFLKTINKTLLKEITSENSFKLFHSLKIKPYIISAKNSADKDAEGYSFGKKSFDSSFYVIGKTNHVFRGVVAKNKLIKKTLEFIKESEASK